MSKKKNKKKQNMSTPWLEFLDAATNIIIIPILVLAVVCSLVMINAKKNNNVPNIFGYSLVTVLSESMVDSGFEVDDTVVVQRTESDEYQIGDVIAYYKYIDSSVSASTLNKQAALSNATGGSYTAQAVGGQHDQANAGDGEIQYIDYSEMPVYSKVSSWKLYLSTLFKNLTYTPTEATEKAIRVNSPIIFHQIVKIVEYDGSRWFQTWGTSNVDAHGDPEYDAYWVREDYVLGKYTHTGAGVRGFLSFASTNKGIIWMVEVPSGLHLILSSLELVEILDIMSKMKKEQIQNGTYIDRKEYKRMLRERRKMMKSENIDQEALRRDVRPQTESDKVVVMTSEIDEFTNANKNGPPEDSSKLSTKDKLLTLNQGEKVVNEEETAEQIKQLQELKDDLSHVVAEVDNSPLLLNEVRLTAEQISAMKDEYVWTKYSFISSAQITNKGLLPAPSKANKVFLVDNKTKKQYSLEKLGVVYSVGSGLIHTQNGVFRVVLDSKGAHFIKIEIKPEYKLISAKQDVFGNIYIGIVGGPVKEEVVVTPDKVRISFFNRNALLALGDDRRLYFLTMEGNYDLAKGQISSLKVMSKSGVLVGVKADSKRAIHFEDSFRKYGFRFLKNNILCLDFGYLFFDVVSGKTFMLPRSSYYLTEEYFVHKDENGKLYRYALEDFIEQARQGGGLEEVAKREFLADDIKSVVLKENHIVCTSATSRKRFIIPLGEEGVEINADKLKGM